ncbi:MAG TPA: translocation/assembly module TamB domain-containing protein [Chitinophagaceae bacterium]|nr:translocation/assembly module TamB domain-containing protein [Chitinophagaceae bacterium]
MLLAFVQTDWGQNWLAHKATSRLSRDLQSRISINHLSIGFFDKLNLEGVMIEDQKRDTLLYAGLLQVRITDWFFLKDVAELHYIGLGNAVINLSRTDSVWNYTYLEDYFATPSTGKKKSAGIRFNLKDVVLDNVSFVQHDGWRGQDLVARVESLVLQANDIGLSDKNIDIRSLELVKPYFRLYSYTGNRPSPFIVPPKTDVLPDTLLQWNPQSWRMAVDRISIKDGTFRNDQDSTTPEAGFFDGMHIGFQAITGEFTKLSMRNDTLLANVQLSTRERSGLLVQSLKTNMRIHPQQMEFKNLTLKTPNSLLGNYFSMRYKSMSALSDFIHAVTMEARFSKAHIASDDLAFFAPALKSWNRTLQMDGKAKGTVDALRGENVSLGIGQGTSFYGDFSLMGLPDINKTFINVTANDLRTNYTDAVTFIPTLKDVTTPDLRKLGHIIFTGNYTGFLTDFVTYGTLKTSLGSISTDLNMKLPKNGAPVYIGKVNTDNFNLGAFINNKQLGTVSFDGNIKGSGFDWKSLNIAINGNVWKFDFNNYTYQNITAKGTLRNRLFNGDIISEDPNAYLSLSGLINLSGKTPTFDVVSDIKKLDLQALHFSNDPIALSGKFNLNFKGNSLINFLGDAHFGNITFQQNGKEVVLDSLQFSSRYTNGIRTLQAQSTEFNATITGDFDLASMPDAVTLFLHKYYPSYIKPPRRTVLKQAFTFDITTGNVEDYVKLIDPRLSGFNNSHVWGKLDVATNLLKLEGDVPFFAFDKYQFSNSKIDGDGDFSRLVLKGRVNNAVVSDSLTFPETTFSLQAQNDVTDFEINTTASQTINSANFSAQIRTFADGASVLFNPSTFVLNGKTWNIEQGGELDFRTNSLLQGQLVLKESQQEIRVSTQPSPIGDWNDLHISLSKINIGDFTPFLVKGYRIEGSLFGDIVIEDPQHKFNVLGENIRTEELRLDEDSIGQVQASLFYNNSTGMLTAKGNNADVAHNVLFDVAIDLKDSAQLFQNRIAVQAVNYPVHILERFLGSLFSEMQGFVTGNLAIVGEGSNTEYIGKARLHDAGMKVNFTQVFYKLDDTEIELTADSIKLGKITLRDKENHTATVRGAIKHKAFQNMVFDIVAETDNRPMELLNTTYNDNQQFYGRAKGTGSFILVGPQNDLFMQVNGRASEQDSSFLTLPPSKSRETGAALFLIEKKYGTEQEAIEYTGAATNITYQVNLAANPMVNVEVILDDLTGDVIKGRGTGNIEIRAGTVEPLSIRGRYNIQEGNYLFTFQSFFKKPFVLRKNADNYIEWTGDPYSATIHFEAGYLAAGVSLAPLASLALGGADSRNISHYRGDVTVVATLTGELFHPAFNFEIEFPPNFYNAMDQTTAFAFQQAIQQIERNTNELNKQVTYLIVFNSFAPIEGNSGSSINPLNEFAYSTISGLFFGEVNKRLNQLLSKILRNNDLTVNFTGSLYNSNLISQTSKAFLPDQSALNVSVGMPLIKERVLITFGSTFDIPLQSNSLQQNIQLFPDVTVEFLINKSGTIRATFFYRQTPELITGGNQTQRAGANLAYRRDFNSLSEFFLHRKKGTRKTKAQAIEPTAPLDSAATTGKQ